MLTFINLMWQRTVNKITFILQPLFFIAVRVMTLTNGALSCGQVT